MSYITRNANLLLLFFLVLSIAFLVGATVFYESNLSRINEKYEEKVSLLKATELELDTKLKQLAQSTQALSLKTEREATFAEKFTDVREEKEHLESEKSSLEKEKQDLDSDLRATRSEMQSLQGRLAISEAEITQLTTERDTAKSEQRQAERLYNEARVQLEQCRANT